MLLQIMSNKTHRISFGGRCLSKKRKGPEINSRPRELKDDCQHLCNPVGDVVNGQSNHTMIEQIHHTDETGQMQYKRQGSTNRVSDFAPMSIIGENALAKHHHRGKSDSQCHNKKCTVSRQCNNIREKFHTSHF